MFQLVFSPARRASATVGPDKKLAIQQTLELLANTANAHTPEDGGTRLDALYQTIMETAEQRAFQAYHPALDAAGEYIRQLRCTCPVRHRGYCSPETMHGNGPSNISNR